MVDAGDSKSSAARYASSSLASGTKPFCLRRARRRVIRGCAAVQNFCPANGGRRRAGPARGGKHRVRDCPILAQAANPPWTPASGAVRARGPGARGLGPGARAGQVHRILGNFASRLRPGPRGGPASWQGGSAAPRPVPARRNCGAGVNHWPNFAIFSIVRGPRLGKYRGARWGRLGRGGGLVMVGWRKPPRIVVTGLRALTGCSGTRGASSKESQPNSRPQGHVIPGPPRGMAVQWVLPPSGGRDRAAVPAARGPWEQGDEACRPIPWTGPPPRPTATMC